jgi:hypothetical protein
MRRTLGNTAAAVATCLVLGGTAGCGSSSSTTATGPASGPSSSATGSPSYPAGPLEGAKVLPLISMTGAGGRPQTVAAPLDTVAELAAFARQFGVPAVRHRIRAEIRAQNRVPGQRVVGQVLTVGCDRPPGADVIVNQEGAVAIVPREVATPLEECLAAVTTVAIAVLPNT